MTYKSTTDHAAELRAALKAKGWNSRKVGVRADYFSMGSSLDVTIKDPTVPLAEVAALAEAHERIDRCAITGEILSGSNRYVSVRYSPEAFALRAKPFETAVRATLDKLAALPDNTSTLLPVEGTPALLGKRDKWTITVWGDSFKGQFHPTSLDYIGNAVADLLAKAA